MAIRMHLILAVVVKLFPEQRMGDCPKNERRLFRHRLVSTAFCIDLPGGTYTEGFESTMLGEILVRQMYSGRKWFVDRYPGVDSAVVAWHQGRC